MDRFEASIWQSSIAADETPLFRSSTDFNASTFPVTGQWTVPLYAFSREGVEPARNLSWFQAQAACRTSGKCLPNSEEWLAAARGTPDPETSSLGDGREGRCLTSISGGVPQVTGGRGVVLGRIGCASAWGAEDMIGNLWEWTADWMAGLGDNTFGAQPWPTGFSNDGTYNIISTASSGLRGIPSALIRGGSSNNATNAGLFAVSASQGPSANDSALGFRCVIPR